MKLLGRDIDARELWEKVEARLQARGLLEAPREPISLDGPEPYVDPLAFHLGALEQHADPTKPLPSAPAQGLIGRATGIAKWAVRLAMRPVVEEVLARQHLFNAHVRDAYAQLSAEVIRLRADAEKRAPTARTSGGELPTKTQGRATRPKAKPAAKPSANSKKPSKKR